MQIHSIMLTFFGFMAYALCARAIILHYDAQHEHSHVIAEHADVETQKLPHNAVIMGMVRDEAAEMPRVTKIVEAIGGLFQNYDVVVLENDSKDSTGTQLRKWSETNPHVIVETPKFHTKKRPSIEWLAQLRNRLLEVAYELSYAGDSRHAWKPDVAIMLDLDAIAVDMNGLVDAAKLVMEDGGLVGATANGVNRNGRYYDVFAFRSCNMHWNAKKGPIYQNGLSNEEWQALMPLYTADLPPFPVESAFGGIGIFRADAVFGPLEAFGVRAAQWKGAESEQAATTYSNTYQLPDARTAPSLSDWFRDTNWAVYKEAERVGREDKLPCVYGDGGLDECEHVTFAACLNARAQKRGLKQLHVVPSFGYQDEHDSYFGVGGPKLLPRKNDAKFNPLVVPQPNSTSVTQMPSYWRGPQDPVQCKCQMWQRC